MESRGQKNVQTSPHFSLYLKCGAILLLLALSFMVVACGQTSSNAATSLGPPPATMTIQFNNGLTGLPTQAPYQCGAWITNTSPAFVPDSIIPVYAKFIHLVNSNPQGVSNATAVATVYFADGQVLNLPQTTTGADGLAVFSFKLPNDQAIANHSNLVTVNFTGANGAACTVDQSRAAYFTPVLVTPTATATTPGTSTATPGKKNGP